MIGWGGSMDELYGSRLRMRVCCLVLLAALPVHTKWFHGDHHHYYFSQGVNVKWSDANRDCKEKGAHLTRIESADENRFLLRKLNVKREDVKLEQGSYWIGLHGFCYSEPCTWQWSDGADQLQFVNWAPGYPTLAEPLTYSYIDHVSGEWRNSGANDYRPYICRVADACVSASPCQAGQRCQSNRRGGYSCATNATASQPDPCSPNPCHNKGKCRAQGNSFSCACASGFRGSRCADDVNECLESAHLEAGRGGLCVHGRCRNTHGGFHCHCEPGYYGEVCALHGDQCSHAQPCLHGNCTNTPSGYNCTCLDGYSGRHCEKHATDSVNKLEAGPEKTTEQNGGSSVLFLAIISGAGLLVVLLIVLLLVIVVIRRRKGSNARQKSECGETSDATAYHDVPSTDLPAQQQPL